MEDDEWSEIQNMEVRERTDNKDRKGGKRERTGKHDGLREEKKKKKKNSWMDERKERNKRKKERK